MIIDQIGKKGVTAWADWRAGEFDGIAVFERRRGPDTFIYVLLPSEFLGSIFSKMDKCISSLLRYTPR